MPLLPIALAVAAVGGGAIALARRFLPRREEWITHDPERKLTTIDAQLQGIDLAAVRAKEPLIMERSIDELQRAIAAGDLTYELLTAFYLDRIRSVDACERGLNAVTDVNPMAIAHARATDDLGPSEGITGIPVLVKDNINTSGMPTSGGTYALRDFVPAHDAPVVSNLLRNGAIILGKANLSELAHFMDLRMPSGYSSRSGQTHNPFGPGVISPSGSSSGSAVAVAANLVSVAVGTETTGSIVAPAAAQSIVGLKPTKGLVPGEGVMPLSSTMDTVGPMARTVSDAVITLNAMLADDVDPLPTDLDDALTGARIGLRDDHASGILARALTSCGATVVPITLPTDGISHLSIIKSELKRDLDRYLTEVGAPVASLGELIALNKADRRRRARYGQSLLVMANAARPGPAKVDAMVRDAGQRIDKTIADHQLDAIVTLNNDGVLLPAVAGCPELTVPVGSADGNKPDGATFFAGRHSDRKLLNLAHSFERHVDGRMVAQKHPGAAVR